MSKKSKKEKLKKARKKLLDQCRRNMLSNNWRNIDRPEFPIFFTNREIYRLHPVTRLGLFNRFLSWRYEDNSVNRPHDNVRIPIIQNEDMSKLMLPLLILGEHIRFVDQVMDINLKRNELINNRIAEYKKLLASIEKDKES